MRILRVKVILNKKKKFSVRILNKMKLIQKNWNRKLLSSSPIQILLIMTIKKKKIMTMMKAMPFRKKKWRKSRKLPNSRRNKKRNSRRRQRNLLVISRQKMGKLLIMQDSKLRKLWTAVICRNTGLCAFHNLPCTLVEELKLPRTKNS